MVRIQLHILIMGKRRFLIILMAGILQKIQERTVFLLGDILMMFLAVWMPLMEQSRGIRKQIELNYGSFIGWNILGAIITTVTLGICYPWALCMVYGWKINHTVVDGHRMRFSGSAIGLFGNWIKWLLLSIVTLGIYGFWVAIKLEDWKVKNTTFIN